MNDRNVPSYQKKGKSKLKFLKSSKEKENGGNKKFKSISLT